MSADYQVHITKQSLHERFNQRAVNFLKAAIEQVLAAQLSIRKGSVKLKSFMRILIKDSTCFQISPHLKSYYPGSGGDGSDAALRIQFEYDLLSGTITDLSVSAFNCQDSTNSVDTLGKVKPGDLIIRDLAYIRLDVLTHIEACGASHLSRLPVTTNVYVIDKQGEFQPIDLSEITAYMKKNNLTIRQIEVYLGKEYRLPVRLIIERLPEAQVAIRLRKANEIALKKGRKVSRRYKAKIHLNLFITNTTPEQIPMTQVWPLYRLRWQIELIFKIWKSICDIDKVKKVKLHRLECYIYGRLLYIILGWKILWAMSERLFSQTGNILSFYKAYRYIRSRTHELSAIVRGQSKDLPGYLSGLYRLCVSYFQLEKRKQEPTSLEILLTYANHS